MSESTGRLVHSQLRRMTKTSTVDSSATSRVGVSYLLFLTIYCYFFLFYLLCFIVIG